MPSDASGPVRRTLTATATSNRRIHRTVLLPPIATSGDAERFRAYGIGGHHRVLYFVTRRPGLTIAELLEILRITKQSLNRVLRELVDKNFVEIRAGTLDRRRRQLYATADGERLSALSWRARLADAGRFALALEQLGDWGNDSALAFLTAMIDPQKRAGDAGRQEPPKRAGGAVNCSARSG